MHREASNKDLCQEIVVPVGSRTSDDLSKPTDAELRRLICFARGYNYLLKGDRVDAAGLKPSDFWFTTIAERYLRKSVFSNDEFRVRNGLYGNI